MNKPNIIIVMSDQMRADLRKSKGYALDTMPFLDKWSAENFEAENAYTPNPSCLPARISMFTGRVPSCHKARTNHNSVDTVYEEDLLDILKKEGYTTALCGKNHTYLTKDDFDFWETNGHLGIESEQNLTAEEKGLDDFLKTTNFCDSLTPSPYTVKEQLPYRNVSSLFKFIDQNNGEKPFFSWVSFAEPHNPYQVPQPYFDMFPPESLPEITTSEKDLILKDSKFSFMREMWKKVYKDDIEARIKRDRSNYLGMLKLIDDQFERLINGLKARNIYDNTIVFFLADHGDFNGEYDLIRKGPALSEPLVHIPFSVGGFKIKQCHNTTDFISLIDILPTLCDCLNVPSPFGCQGKSFLPLLEGKEYNAEEFEIAYSESGFSGLYFNEKDAVDPVTEGATKDWNAFDCLNTWTQAGQVRMVRKGDFKLIVDMMKNVYLYNIKEDKNEINNLADKEIYSSIKADLLLEMAAQMMRFDDTLPSPRHRYRVKTNPKGYWFDKDFHLEKDPEVQIHPLYPEHMHKNFK